MKEWGDKSDGPVSPWLWLEAFAWGVAILVIFAFGIYSVKAELLGMASLCAF